jgi:tRNA 2-thiouridine synthesizing protein B
MALYLIDKPYGQNGLDLARLDPEAHVVLVQDGVYLDPGGLANVYALEEDALKRGVAARLPASVRLIGYGDLVDLIVAHKVVNFA